MSLCISDSPQFAGQLGPRLYTLVGVSIYDVYSTIKWIDFTVMKIYRGSSSSFNYPLCGVVESSIE